MALAPTPTGRNRSKGAQVIVLTGGRRSGKTTALIRWLCERPVSRCIFVVSEDRRRHLLNQLRDTLPNYDWRPHVLVADRYFGGLIGRMRVPFPEVAFDDMETILEHMLQANVEMVALNATWIPLAPVDPEPIRIPSYQDLEEAAKRIRVSEVPPEILAYDDSPFDVPPGSLPPRQIRGRDGT